MVKWQKCIDNTELIHEYSRVQEFVQASVYYIYRKRVREIYIKSKGNTKRCFSKVELNASLLNEKDTVSDVRNRFEWVKQCTENAK